MNSGPEHSTRWGGSTTELLYFLIVAPQVAWQHNRAVGYTPQGLEYTTGAGK